MLAVYLESRLMPEKNPVRNMNFFSPVLRKAKYEKIEAAEKDQRNESGFIICDIPIRMGDEAMKKEDNNASHSSSVAFLISQKRIRMKRELKMRTG